MRRLALALAVLAALIVSGVASAGVPGTLSFSARLVDEETGEALTGPHQMRFVLFDRASGGTMLWQEAQEVIVDDGTAYASVGRVSPLEPSLFADGGNRWLEVQLDGVTMEPRIPIDSVPYAMHAAEADRVGELVASDVQKRVTGNCSAGNFIIGVNVDGSVTCAPDLSGAGDVTAVFAGSGLQGGGNSGDITLSLTQTCAINQILKWSGSAWTCAPDAGGVGGSGDITAVNIGTAGGLAGGGASGDVALSLLTTCAANQVLKWNGTSWACANDNDVDTNSGGDISDVIAGAGLTGGAGAGAATLNVGMGQGITVAADTIALDTAFTDARYLNTTGDTLTGSLDAGGFRVSNRGCPAGYVLAGAGSALCTENFDAASLTFTGCANRCRAAAAHMCTSAEMRAILASGVTLGDTLLLDWIDDQDAVGSAFYVASSTPDTLDGVRPVTTASFCRCCTDVE